MIVRQRNTKPDTRTFSFLAGCGWSRVSASNQMDRKMREFASCVLPLGHILDYVFCFFLPLETEGCLAENKFLKGTGEVKLLLSLVRVNPCVCHRTMWIIWLCSEQRECRCHKSGESPYGAGQRWSKQVWTTRLKLIPLNTALYLMQAISIIQPLIIPCECMGVGRQTYPALIKQSALSAFPKKYLFSGERALCWNKIGGWIHLCNFSLCPLAWHLVGMTQANATSLLPAHFVMQYT